MCKRLAMRNKFHTSSGPDLPPIKENGLSGHQGAFIPVMHLSPPATEAVVELPKCGCKSDCKGSCSCFKNGIPCIPLCKCFGKSCTNPYTDGTQVDDEEDDDGDALNV